MIPGVNIIGRKAISKEHLDILKIDLIAAEIITFQNYKSTQN